MEVSYMNLVSDSKECYNKIHKYFHRLSELYDSENELFNPTRISMTVDIIIQCILLNMAGDDSQCSQLEVAYISNFCDYANLATLAKVEWSTFTRFDQTSLRNFLDSISEAFLSKEIKPYFVTPFSMIDRDYDGAFLLNIRKKLKKIFHNFCLMNGDNPDSFAYERAVKIGKDIFDNLVGKYWENEL